MAPRPQPPEELGRILDVLGLVFILPIHPSLSQYATFNYDLLVVNEHKSSYVSRLFSLKDLVPQDLVPYVLVP